MKVIQSTNKVRDLVAAWDLAGCMIVRLPDHGGIVVAPSKGVMLEVNPDGCLLLEKISTGDLSSNIFDDSSICIDFIDRVIEVLR
jgi:hypothetical protein